MKCVIQTIPARLEFAERQAKVLGVHTDIFVDKDLQGPFKGFIQSLRDIPSGEQYRLHMQDDLILCPGLIYYLPTLQREMREKSMHYLSFYASRRKVFSHALKAGERIIKAPIENYLPLLCTILSPWLVDRLLAHSHQFDQDNKADDMYLAAVMKHYKTPAYYHIPSLAQHDIGIKSSIGYTNNKMRTSAIFDEQFVGRWLTKPTSL